MDPILKEWLERIEGKVDHLVGRVDRLEVRASFWGAVGGGLGFALAWMADKWML